MKKASITVFFVVLMIVSFQRFFFEYIFEGGRSYQSYLGFFCELGILAISLIEIKRNNYFLKLLILFIISTFITYLLNQNDISLISHVNGLRPYLMVFAAIIFFNDIIESKYWLYFHHLMVKFIVLILSLHTVTAMFEFAIHGANDTVGGGMGTGGSGVLTLLVYCSVFFLIVNKSTLEKNENINLSGSWYYLLFLLPSFINETKVTFLLLPVLFILLVRLTLKNMLNSLFVMAGIALAFFIYASVYGKIASGQESFISNPLEVFTSKDFLSHYLMRQESVDYNVPRFTKLIMGFQILSSDIVSLLFGRGLGLFKGYDLIGISDFVRNYQWLLLGTNFYLFTTFFETGLIGFLIIAFTVCKCLWIKSFFNPVNRFRIFLQIVLCLMIFYNTAMNEMPFVLPIAYFLSFSYKFNLFHEKWEYYTQTVNS